MNMKYIRTGIPDPDVLKIPEELVPKDFALLSPFGRLDFLLNLMITKFPHIVEQYVEKLQSLYESISKKDEVAERGINIEGLIHEKHQLALYPNLAKSNLNYFLHELKLPVEADWAEKQQVPEGQKLRAFLMSIYYNLYILTKVMDRDSAINLHKEYVQSFWESYYIDAIEKFDTLEEWVQNGIESDLESRGAIRIWGQVENGKIVIR